MLGPVKKNTLYLVTICDLSKKITCSSIILGMPPKADYWKYFNVVGVVAYCLIAECKQPNVSLGALPKPGEKKSVEDLVDSVLFSELQDVECLAWWEKMEPSLVAKGPAGVALVSLAKR